MEKLRSVLVSLSVLASGSAFAEPATTEGAKAIEASYVQILGKSVVDSGILDVTAQGDNYLVTWNLPRAIELLHTTSGQVIVEPLLYTITPGAGGAWSLLADKVPAISFDLPERGGRAVGRAVIEGGRLSVEYDPARPDFVRTHAVAPSFSLDFRSSATRSSPASLFIAQKDIAFDLTQTKSALGSDIIFTQSLGRFDERLVGDAGGAAAGYGDLAYSAEGAAGSTTIANLRSKELGDLWNLWLVNKERLNEMRPELALAMMRPFLLTAMPFWDEVNAKAGAAGITMSLPMASMSLKGVEERFRMTGAAPTGEMSFGLTVDELVVKSALAPPFAEALQPLSMDLTLTAALNGADRIARALIVDPEKFEQTAREITLAGDPRLIIEPGMLKTPIVELHYSGRISLIPDHISARLLVTADSLDKVVDIAREIEKTIPEADKAGLVAAFVKGLARTDADGKLSWDIVYQSSPERVMINDIQMPK